MTEYLGWNGADLLHALTISNDLLNANRSAIDALNVFPVPDGDTGANLCLTMQAALNEAHEPGEQALPVGIVAQRIARGSMLGAKGNSGVILSQILRGFADAFTHQECIHGRDIARGLRSGSDAAYQAVLNPVEGTMLTVIRSAADAAERVAPDEASLTAVLESALNGACEALVDTPNLLDSLRRAEVVDSGGQGVVLLLQGLLAAAKGARPDSDERMMSAVPKLAHPHLEHDSFGYCTNFMICGTGIPIAGVRSELTALGTSAVIIGDETRIKVHIHTENPGLAIEYAMKWGTLTQVKIDNMQDQVSSFSERSLNGLTKDGAGDAAIVAIATGAGLANALRSIGVSKVIITHQGMTPTLTEVLTAVRDLHNPNVIFLPDSCGSLMMADQLATQSESAIHVIPTRSIAQSLAAAAAFRAGQPLQRTLDAMHRAIRRVRTVEVRRADCEPAVNGAEGQYVGIIDDQTCIATNDLVETAVATLVDAASGSCELLTIFLGADVDESSANELLRRLSSQLGEIEIELLPGGQAHTPIIAAVE